ncbi:MAG: type II secretion system minor pseudopilin GspH [Moraxellaceae bacterium]
MQRRPLVVHRGFTLLEVLLVVVLVAIISSIAMLGMSAGGDERRLRNESDRLMALLQQVSSEAVMQNQEYGLQITDVGYAFLCLDEVKQRWQACVSETSLQEYHLPEGMEVRILRDSQLKLPLATDTDKKQDRDADAEKDTGPRIYPDILLLSSGEASPASLEILVSDQPEIRSEIRIDELGRVSRDSDDAEAEKEAGDE